MKAFIDSLTFKSLLHDGMTVMVGVLVEWESGTADYRNHRNTHQGLNHYM